MQVSFCRSLLVAISWIVHIKETSRGILQFFALRICVRQQLRVQHTRAYATRNNNTRDHIHALFCSFFVPPGVRLLQSLGKYFGRSQLYGNIVTKLRHGSQLGKRHMT